MWLEEVVGDSDTDAIWRGHITHVPDGARRYFESVDALPAFITPYLKGTAVKVTRLARLRQWLNKGR